MTDWNSHTEIARQKFWSVSMEWAEIFQLKVCSQLRWPVWFPPCIVLLENEIICKRFVTHLFPWEFICFAVLSVFFCFLCNLPLCAFLLIHRPSLFPQPQTKSCTVIFIWKTCYPLLVPHPRFPTIHCGFEKVKSLNIVQILLEFSAGFLFVWGCQPL